MGGKAGGIRVATVLTGVLLAMVFVGSSPASGATLAFEERVAAQRALAEVRAHHRVQPGGLPAAPIARRDLQVRVEDYLAKSLALETVWGLSIGSDELQRELDRMARDTRDPDRLRELFAALDDDPFLAAECLARPTLIERTIRELYAFDPGMHAELNEKIRAGSGGRTLEYDVDREDRQRWDLLSARPIGEASALLETATYFETETVVDRSAEEIHVSRTRWTKRPFDVWWIEDAPERDVAARAIPVPGGPYTLPAAPEAACTNDTWLATSTAIGVPEPRQNHTAIWTGAEMIVWGGRDPSFYDTGGVYDPAIDSWTPTPVGGNAPSARAWHSAVWTGTEMIVWGGSGAVDENTGARYDPVLNTWTPVPIDASTPSARARHSAVWTGTRMVVWGGIDAVGNLDTGGVYEPSPGSDSWKTTSVSAVPLGRSGHTTVWTGTEMIVWGGFDGLTAMSSGGRYDPALDAWTATGSDPGAPFARQNHSAVWTGDEMIVWGGIGIIADDSGARYDPATDSWTPTAETTGVPSPRRWQTAIWTDLEMIVWGGLGGGDTGSRYSPLTDAWTPTSTATGVPAGRRHHTAVWLGPGETKMIVWGGVISASTDTGGVYCAVCNALDWHADLDLDGFGDPALPQASCAPIPGLILDGTDCDDTAAAVYPGAAQVCDGLNNDCDDAGWPGLAGTNEFDNDTDGFSVCGGDCDDLDLDIWMLPGNVQDVLFGADKQTLDWNAPALLGSTAVIYDTVRADTATTFDPAGVCVETDDGVDLQSVDAGVPPSGAVYYYLVRAQNGCGQGSVSDDSNGVPRTATGCP